MPRVADPDAEDTLPPSELDTYAQSFALYLRAQNRSPATIKSYLSAVAQLDTFLAERGMPRSIRGIRREHIESFVVDRLERHSPATAANRFRSLQQFFRWLVEEDEIEASPMSRMRAPKVPVQPPPILAQDELQALLGSCAGTSFDDRRDRAILTVLLETGIRRGECAGLQLDDLDVLGGQITVLGKGGRRRTIALGAAACTVLDRYLRRRRDHPNHRLPAIWLGRWGAMTSDGIRYVVETRSKQAGLGHVNPHRFRHTWAHYYMAAGGQETNLMHLAGWQSESMLRRYAASAGAERAMAEQRRLSLVDRLAAPRRVRG